MEAFNFSFKNNFFMFSVLHDEGNLWVIDKSSKLDSQNTNNDLNISFIQTKYNPLRKFKLLFNKQKLANCNLKVFEKQDLIVLYGKFNTLLLKLKDLQQYLVDIYNNSFDVTNKKNIIKTNLLYNYFYNDSDNNNPNYSNITNNLLIPSKESSIIIEKLNLEVLKPNEISDNDIGSNTIIGVELYSSFIITVSYLKSIFIYDYVLEANVYEKDDYKEIELNQSYYNKLEMNKNKDMEIEINEGIQDIEVSNKENSDNNKYMEETSISLKEYELRNNKYSDNELILSYLLVGQTSNENGNIKSTNSYFNSNCFQLLLGTVESNIIVINIDTEGYAMSNSDTNKEEFNNSAIKISITDVHKISDCLDIYYRYSKTDNNANYKSNNVLIKKLELISLNTLLISTGVNVIKYNISIGAVTKILEIKNVFAIRSVSKYNFLIGGLDDTIKLFSIDFNLINDINTNERFIISINRICEGNKNINNEFLVSNNLYYGLTRNGEVVLFTDKCCLFTLTS